ncbi:MAG: GerMN domain-containing protein [Thermoanaerobaculia bacterium]
MSRRAAALVVGVTAALAVTALVWWSLAGRQTTESPVGGEPRPAGEVEMSEAELYFPNTAGWLGRENRDLPVARDAEERAAQVAVALLAGPTEPGNLAPLGAGVELASLHLTGDGVVYVDLAAARLAIPPVAGSRAELLVVYSFVNSILANVPEARGVVLMWNGNQRPTFAGHVDTTRPLTQEHRWLADR